MAYKEISLNDGWKLSCTATETGTDTGTNTSTISVTGRIWRTSTSWAFSYTGAGKLEIYWHDTNNGTDQLLASLDVSEIGYSVSERTLNKTFSVTHKADGKLSGWAWAVWTKYSSSVNVPPSGSAYTEEFDMTDIPRGAKLTTVPDFNDEANPTVVYSNPAGNAVDLLQLGIFGTNGTTAYAGYRDISKTGTSYTFNLTTTERNALRNAIPNAKSMKVRVYIKTGIGSNTFLDYKEATMTIINGTPTFSNFTFADTNSTTTAVTGNNQVMISGKSSLSATITAANKAVAVKGASITKYTFAIAGLTAEQAYSTSDITKAIGSPTVASNELPSGTRDLVITATDSRGFTKAVTKTVTIVPYNAPIVNASANRANNFESTTTIKIKGTISRIEVGGTAKNTVNATSGVQYRYKASTTSTWGSWTNRASTVDASTGAVSTTDFTLELDNQTAYDFQMKIADKLATSTVDISVPVGQPAMWMGADGRIGIGGMPSYSKGSSDTGLLDVKGKIYASTNIYAGQDLQTEQGWLKSTYSQLHTGGATTVPANANLNTATYCTVGRYVCASNATGQTVSNNPSGSAFYMEVSDKLANYASISGSWRYFRRVLHSGVNDNTWEQQVTSNGSGTISYGPWKLCAKIDSDFGKITTAIKLTGTVSADTTVTARTNYGTNLTIYRKNNGALNIVTGSSIDYVHRTTSVWNNQNFPNNIGVSGLAANSTIWSYYSGTKNNANGAWNESLRVDGSTPEGFYFGTAITDGGNKYGWVADYVARRMSGQTWSLLGCINASGSGFALRFGLEVTASSSAVIPSIYLRAIPPTSATIADQLEFVQ